MSSGFANASCNQPRLASGAVCGAGLSIREEDLFGAVFLCAGALGAGATALG